jgi:predicted metalloprotease
MKWDPTHESANVEDGRGQSGGGGGIGLPIGRMGIGGTIVLLVLSLIFGKNLLGGRGFSNSNSGPNAGNSAEDDKLVHFVGFVLDDAQNNWAKILPAQAHKDYRDAKLHLFTDSVRSGCGYAETAMGPFYCPADEKVYIDLGFYRELRDRFGAPGEFAQAYVIAHEIGHHVQKIVGTEQWVREQERGMSKEEQNALSVRVELQADCYAGIWASTTAQHDILEKGDIESAMGAAAAVGDDRLEKQAGVAVNPERWTHGSSASRTKWFNVGFKTGRMDACDTFHAKDI